MSNWSLFPAYTVCIISKCSLYSHYIYCYISICFSISPCVIWIPDWSCYNFSYISAYWWFILCHWLIWKTWLIPARLKLYFYAIHGSSNIESCLLMTHTMRNEGRLFIVHRTFYEPIGVLRAFERYKIGMKFDKFWGALLKNKLKTIRPCWDILFVRQVRLWVRQLGNHCKVTLKFHNFDYNS